MPQRDDERGRREKLEAELAEVRRAASETDAREMAAMRGWQEAEAARKAAEAEAEKLRATVSGMRERHAKVEASWQQLQGVFQSVLDELDIHWRASQAAKTTAAGGDGLPVMSALGLAGFGGLASPPVAGGGPWPRPPPPGSALESPPLAPSPPADAPTRDPPPRVLREGLRDASAEEVHRRWATEVLSARGGSGWM